MIIKIKSSKVFFLKMSPPKHILGKHCSKAIMNLTWNNHKTENHFWVCMFCCHYKFWYTGDIVTYNFDDNTNKVHDLFWESLPSAGTDLIKSPKYDLKVMSHNDVFQLKCWTWFLLLSMTHLRMQTDKQHQTLTY